VCLVCLVCIRFSNRQVKGDADHTRAQALVRCMVTALVWKLVAVFAVMCNTATKILSWWTCSIEFAYHGLNSACSGLGPASRAE